MKGTLEYEKGALKFDNGREFVGKVFSVNKLMDENSGNAQLHIIFRGEVQGKVRNLSRISTRRC